jgi:hypothetical protein
LFDTAKLLRGRKPWEGRGHDGGRNGADADDLIALAEGLAGYFLAQALASPRG